MLQVGKALCGGGAQAGVGADAAADTDLLDAHRPQRGGGLFHEHIHHGLLKGCRQIGQHLWVVQIDAFGCSSSWVRWSTAVLRPEKLKSKRWSAAWRRPARAADRAPDCRPPCRRPAGWRAAGKTQVEQARHLVECLAGSIVERAAQPPVVAVGRHQHQFGVAAGDDQNEHGKRSPALAVGPSRPLCPASWSRYALPSD